MTTPPAIPDGTPIAARLALAVDMIDGIDKKGRNEAQGYDFLRAVDVTRAVREVLVNVGVYAAVSIDRQTTTIIPRDTKPPLILSDVEGAITFHNTATPGESITIRAAGQGADYGGDKATPKAITSLIKYALRSAFLIPDETTDPENDSAEHPPVVSAEQPPLRTAERPVTGRTAAPPISARPPHDQMIDGPARPVPPRPEPAPALASDTMKAKLRVEARKVGLDGPAFKAFMVAVTGKASSKELTIGDIDRALAKLKDSELVAEFATATYGEQAGA